MRPTRTAIAMLLAACTTGTATSSVTSNSLENTSAVTAVAPTSPSAATTLDTTAAPALPVVTTIREYPVPAGSHPHDVAPAPDGTIWYTGQGSGVLGRLNPASGDIHEVSLGRGAAPHGVIVGPDGAPWITDSGLNAIVRVDPETSDVDVYSVGAVDANLNTSVFDLDGILWFTGQSGVYGRFDTNTKTIEIFDAPGGRGPYGITVTPENEVFYASLAGSHIAHIDRTTGDAQIVEPPTPAQGARRVWSDSNGVVWVSEWNAGQVAAYDPNTGDWSEWPLPGDNPQAYAVYVDETDRVWITDFAGAGALVRFDPVTEGFESYPLPTAGGNVRQLLGRDGEVWGAESAADSLIVVRYG